MPATVHQSINPTREPWRVAVAWRLAPGHIATVDGRIWEAALAQDDQKSCRVAELQDAQVNGAWPPLAGGREGGLEC